MRCKISNAILSGTSNHIFASFYVPLTTLDSLMFLARHDDSSCHRSCSKSLLVVPTSSILAVLVSCLFSVRLVTPAVSHFCALAFTTG